MRTGSRRSGIEKNDMRLPLERWEYGNPEAVAERRQARSCHGCRHESKIRMGWNNLEFCEKGRKHGVRCTFFSKKGVWQMKFNDPQHALSWAYETTSRPIVKISSVNAMRGPDRTGEGANGELTAYDLHAQAALILSLCNRILSDLHMAYINVQFGREASGFDLLSRHLAANFGTGIHNRRGIEQIIRAYCGQKIGLREIRKTMSCGMLKAASLRNRGYDALDLIHDQAMDMLQREMESRGLLRSPVLSEIA